MAGLHRLLPDGGHNKVTAKLPTIAAFLCIKAITLMRADEEEGCVLIAEGIAILRDKFARLDSIGPVWAAQTAEEATAGTAFDLEMQQRRAYELVNALLRQIDEAK